MLTGVLRRRLRMRRRGEDGAVAIMFAMLTVVLFGIAALSVDMGNMIARRTDTQSQADFGAFAAAQYQNESAKSGMAISPAMQDAVRDALNNNQPQDDTSNCWHTKSCVTSAQLLDGNLTNGEIRYCQPAADGGPACSTGSSSRGLQIIAPDNKVDFGFANFLGIDSAHVQGKALVNVFTAGQRVMPLYAVSGCDYGLQTLSDPSHGHTTPSVPSTLAAPGDSNQNTLVYNQATSPFSPQLKDSGGTVVAALTLNSADNSVEIDASKWKDLDAIGFFRSNGDPPAIQTAFGLAPAFTGLTAPYTENSGSRIALKIPDPVAAAEEVWWIRARDDTGVWSPLGEALPIRVGNAVLECDAGSMAGNFGTLKFPRTDVATADEIPANIALGLQEPLSPTVHQWALANPTLAGTCANGVNGALTAPNGSVVLVQGVNCVDTDTGLAANFATEGLVQGSTYGPGVLTTENTRSGCGPGGSSSNRTLPITGNPSINNDTLTCYFTNGTTSIQQIASASYNGGIVLDPAILSSPRFFYVPVLAIQPTTGGTHRYSIIDFRPAFITDETATTAAIKGSNTGTADNGLILQGNDIKHVKVVFFNIGALPSEGDVPIIDYLGVGNRVIRLID